MREEDNCGCVMTLSRIRFMTQGGRQITNRQKFLALSSLVEGLN